MQATKVMAIGFGFRLWRSPDREGYASIKIGDHYENYRIQSSAFETLVLAKYGERHQGKIGDEWYPQIPSDAALKAGMKGIASRAVHRGQEFEPAVRVGGTPGVVWLDLGRDDWRVVKITREGWNVVPAAEVAFIRTNSMRPLPIPVRGGNVRSLLRVMNVREEDFVLMAGWLLQTINPKGPYAILYLNGLSEAGKSTVSKLALRTVDPDALNRHRGKGQQKVTVEHVHVHAGGQAVVGMVEGPGGGDRPKLEDQPRAKQIAHAPQPAVWSADEEREPVRVAGDAEWPLPDARRPLSGRAEG